MYKAVGSTLNWFNLQYYNQNNYYENCDVRTACASAR